MLLEHNFTSYNEVISVIYNYNFEPDSVSVIISNANLKQVTLNEGSTVLVCELL